MRKHMKMIILIVVIFLCNVVVYHHQKNKEGIHDFYTFKLININQDVYVYDELDRRITGDMQLSMNATMNKLIQAFKGSIDIEQYPIHQAYDITYNHEYTPVFVLSDDNYSQFYYEGIYFDIYVDDSNPWDVKNETEVYRSPYFYDVYILDDSLLIRVYEMSQDNESYSSFETEIDGEIIYVEGYTGGGALNHISTLIYTNHSDVNEIYDEFIRHFVD